MARTFLTHLDLLRNELRNAVIQVLATAPANPVQGQVYYDSVANKAYIYNGSAWKALDTIDFGEVGDIAASAPGDTAVAGSTGEVADAGHVHARESFATTASTQAVGDSAAGGSATTVSRGDHKHAMPGFEATPSTQAIGDAAAGGSATTIARGDHKHAMPSFGNVSAQTSFGGSSANGSATSVARSDHQHGTPTHDASAHSSISLSAFTAPTGDLSAGTYKITNLATPSADTDAANKGYVDSVANGLDVKASVRVATTANITLSNTQTIDGISLTAGDRVLVKNQSTGAENGIYVVVSGGAWTRATDANTSAKVTPGLFTFVEQGTANGDTGWVLTTDAPITLDTTALTFTQFSAAGSYLAGNGLQLVGNTFSVVASTGISVSGSGVAIDTSVVARKYVTDITGNGSATTFTVTHNLGTRDVIVQVIDSDSPYNQVETDVERTTTNTVTIGTATAIANNKVYRVVVTG